MKRLGTKLDGDELYEEFQRIYDESVGRDAGKDKAEDKMWNRSRGRWFLCISPIHFTQLNYILKTRKQSQDVAIVIDDVVILWYHIKIWYMKAEVKMKVLVMNCSPVRNGATAEIVNIVTACL